MNKSLQPITYCGFLCVIIIALSFMNCSGGRNARVVKASSLAGNQTESQPPEYKIGVLDELEIRFFYHERYNEKALVRPDGRITLENVGDVYVAGMTPAQLDELITEAYSKVVFNPEVTVFVRGFASQQIFVLGEVDDPGIVDLKPRMTALQAIAAAGGPVSGAKLGSVVVLRHDQTGQLHGVSLNLSRGAIAGADADDYQLLPQDIVFVPKTFISSMTDFLSEIYSGFFPPIDVYLRGLREYNRTN